MVIVKRDYPESASTLRLRFYADNVCLSHADFLRSLSADASFREIIQEEMYDAPFVAFRWETPPLTSASVDQPFACLLHDSPDLDVQADPSDFEAYFQPGSDVASFTNLGGDALLIVPCPTSASANYSHMGAFHRSAPREQLHAFWTAVACAVLEQLGQQPLWLSTRRRWCRLAAYATRQPPKVLSLLTLAQNHSAI